MAKDNFSDPFFHDEAAACAWFDKAGWPNGPVCPRYKKRKTLRDENLWPIPLYFAYVSQGFHRYDWNGHGVFML